ncbi:tripartite tricarboxylate transporter permease [Salirhabdus salicampi]|uniref:tripartite tricarboxylate transporter permease n=1 Tax=Salirhabdus salicampi TaxID=476102 RepID=UPI0020C1D48D|nr:tripartite tricarboxylate transporter permease [Salirhabdus salicampi]MCP8615662.1 tripartite tricarboxylate transporter permease [Salirhabdus salicampi]
MDLLLFDFSQLLTWQNLLVVIIGILYGLFIGTLPGMGATIGIALLLPLTYELSPLAAILMLVAVYQSAEYGCSISAVVMGVPGTPAAAATMIDGNALAKKGYPGKALGYSLTGSVIGGIIGVIILMTLAIPLSSIAIDFADPEIFLIGILALVSVASLGTHDVPKSIISILLGLLLGLVGLDVLTGTSRFTFGVLSLMDGINYIALVVGVFAITEVLLMMGDLNKKYVTDSKNLKTHITWKEFKGVSKSMTRGSFIGAFTGVLPGLGAGPAAWFAYMDAKRNSKKPENFGKGEPDGIASPEAANNSAVGGALVPLLTLGIPGSPATAVILGAFLIQGITPGPSVFKNDFGLIAGIFWGFLLATILMYYIGKYTTSLWARMLTFPNFALTPIILLVSLVGVYAARNNIMDVWVAVIAGIFAFFMKKLDYSLPAFILAFILGPIIEESLRRTLVLSDGSYTIFLDRGYCLIILALIAIVVFGSIFKKHKNKKAAPSDLDSTKNMSN